MIFARTLRATLTTKPRYLRGKLIGDIRGAKKAWQVDEAVAQLGQINTLKELTIVMSSYRRTGQPGKALDVFNDAKERGLPLDVILYSAAISACEKAGQWKPALKLLKEMR